MKRYLLAIALIAAVAWGLLGAAEALGNGQDHAQHLESASTPSLAAQVRKLTLQVRKLQKQTKVLANTDGLLAAGVVTVHDEVVTVHDDVVANYQGDICILALASDEFGEEWNQLNNDFKMPFFWVNYSPPSDQGACTAVGLTRPPYTGQPPSPAPLTDLMGKLVTLSKN